MQKVICISKIPSPFHCDIVVGKVYYIDTSSIYGDSDGEWYAEVFNSELMVIYYGRINLKHFKSAV